MYKLTVDQPQDENASPHLIVEWSQGERRFSLSRPELYQLLGKMDVFSTGNPTIIEDFPAPDANPGGEAPLGTLTSWPIHTTATPDAIRQARLKPVEEVIELIALEVRKADLKNPVIGTSEGVPDDGPRFAIPEDVLSAIRERVETSLAN